MKKIILPILLAFASLTVHAQFVATLQAEEPIEGACDTKSIYVLMSFLKKQEAPECILSKKEMEQRLNNEVAFLKENQTLNDTAMVSVIINCRGEMIQCKIDNPSTDEELDRQLLAVFQSFTEWKAGKLNRKNVDSVKLISFRIEEGKVVLN